MQKNFLLLFFFFGYSLLQGQQTVGLFLNDSLAQNGYTLFAPNKKTYLIDNCGFVVNTWNATSNPGLSVYLLEDGSLLRAGSLAGDLMGPGAGGRLQRYSWDGILEWSYTYASESFHQHHDIEPLPNGNILVLAWEVISQDSAIAAGRAADVTNKAVWPEKIVELQPIGSDSATVVWEWHAWDHLIQDQDSTKSNFGVVENHPELIDVNFAAENTQGTPGVTGIDWLHANGIAYHPIRDEIILSIRNFSELWIIDHSTTTEEAKGHTGGNAGKGGDILYRWGNPQAYGRGTEEDQVFYSQHDAQWIPDGYPNAGQILVYNNGNERPMESYSSIDFISPPLDQNGQYSIELGKSFAPTALSRTIDQYQNERFYSGIMSGAQPLPNGNILVCVAIDGHFFEVTPNDEIVWDYRSPVNFNGPVNQGSGVAFQSVFRATRYLSDFQGFDNKNLSAGDPIELNPLPSDCVIYDGTITSINDASDMEGISLQNNPVETVISLNNDFGRSVEVLVFNLLGQLLFFQESQDLQIEINVSEWAAGLYPLIVREKNGNKKWQGKVWKR